MLKLSLLRHAKSSWDDPALEDYARPLAKRGIKAARRIARYLERECLVPERILCSGAVRTRATVALILAELHHPPSDVAFDDALYLASSKALRGTISNRGNPARHVMLVGHNPGLHALALELVADGEREALTTLARGFPTATLATFEIEAASWGELRAASARLVRVITPEDARK